MKLSNNLGLLVLAVVALAGAVVISAAGKTVPSELWNIALILSGAVAGVSLPAAAAVLSAASTPPALAAPPAPVPAPAQVAAAPLPVPGAPAGHFPTVPGQ